MVLVLLGVDTEALGNEINFNTIDVLNQTSDRRHELLHDVPIDVGLQIILLCHDFVETESRLFERESRDWLSKSSILLLLLCLFLLFTDDVTDEVVDEVG